MADDAFKVSEAIARMRNENKENTAKQPSSSFAGDLGKIVKALTKSAAKPTPEEVSHAPIPKCSEIEAGKADGGRCYKDSKYTGR